MKVLINLLRGILALVWALALAVIIGLYMSGRAGEVPPRLMGFAVWTVADGSMGPEYAEGDLAILELGAEAKPGDPVLARNESGLVFTRIIGTTGDQLILKGDSGEESFLSTEEAVEGVCAAYLPGFGGAAEFLRSLPGIAAVFLAGLALIILPGIRPRRKRKGRRGDSRQAVEPVEAAARPAPTPPANRSASGAHAGRNRYTPKH